MTGNIMMMNNRMMVATLNERLHDLHDVTVSLLSGFNIQYQFAVHICEGSLLSNLRVLFIYRQCAPPKKQLCVK